jgi:hypothetical protein
LVIRSKGRGILRRLKARQGVLSGIVKIDVQEAVVGFFGVFGDVFDHTGARTQGLTGFIQGPSIGVVNAKDRILVDDNSLSKVLFTESASWASKKPVSFSSIFSLLHKNSPFLRI